LKALILLFIFSLNSPLFAGELNSHQKIEKLLQEVEKSDLIFVRNNKEYSSKQARSHLEYKYNYVRDGFWFWQSGSAVDVNIFIEKIASGSSTSGKEYYIKDKTGKLTPSRLWLKEKLKLIEHEAVHK
jgi:hypothetical protein